MYIGLDPDESLQCQPVEQIDLGDGLTRVVTAWLGREARGEPFQLLGEADGFQIDLGDGRRLEIELDRAFREFDRRAHLLWPTGKTTLHRAQDLLDLARLLRRDEVYQALAKWAAEDAGVEGGQG